MGLGFRQLQQRVNALVEGTVASPRYVLSTVIDVGAPGDAVTGGGDLESVDRVGGVVAAQKDALGGGADERPAEGYQPSYLLVSLVPTVAGHVSPPRGHAEIRGAAEVSRVEP